MTQSGREASEKQADCIRSLNDAMRRAVPLTNGTDRLTVTSEVAALHNERLTELLLAVRDFGEFDAKDDPDDERDFGALEFDGARYFWKIDYYDQSLCNGSPNAADPTLTVRVLTVMRADEY